MELVGGLGDARRSDRASEVAAAGRVAEYAEFLSRAITRWADGHCQVLVGELVVGGGRAGRRGSAADEWALCPALGRRRWLDCRGGRGVNGAGRRPAAQRSAVSEVRPELPSAALTGR